MLLNKVTVSGTFSSENGLGGGTDISLGYRDLGTGEITILSTNKTIKDENSKSTGFTKNHIDSDFIVSAENVQVYEGGKQLILIYNGKYQEVNFEENNIIGLTGNVFGIHILDNKIEDDSVDFEASFVKNSKVDPYKDDPIINWYLIEDGFENNDLLLPLTGKNKQEIEDYFSNLYGIDHGTISRNIEINYVKEQGIPIKKIYDTLFEKTDLEEVLKNTGYSSNQIQKIREEGMLKNMDIYQKVNKSDWQIRVEQRLEEYRKDPKKLENLIGNNKNIKKENEGIQDNQSLNENLVITKIKNTEIDIKTGDNGIFSILNFILVIFIFIGFIGLFLYKRYIKKNKNSI